MGYINVRKANCKNCYKCLKNCIVKSIKYKNEKVEILEDMCILCGACITTCPQKAKKVDNDLSNLLEYINDNQVTTVASIDPAFIATFGENSKHIPMALKALGFDYVEESAIGAKYVTREYLRLINEGKMENIIASACPTVNLYIEKYYPQLVKYLAPVMSPAIVHGKLIKDAYGEDTRVIHITPCLSRIKEVKESQWVDGAITFEQLINLFKYRDIDITTEFSEMPFDKDSGYSRIYPIVDGINYDIQHQANAFGATDKIGNYDLVSASGLPNITTILNEMKDGNFKNVFVEAMSCYGGCVHGPFIGKKTSTGYKARIDVKNYADNGNDLSFDDIGSIAYEYSETPVVQDIPTEDEIRRILALIGKNSKAHELNCGSCGYSTCREKAIAVYQGKAELYICLPYMTDINQAMSNVTLSLTPNYIIAVDSEMYIKEFNVAAQRLFNISRAEAINQKLSNFIDTKDFENVISNKRSIYDKKVRYDDIGIVTEQTIVYSKDRNMAIAIIKDVTNEEKKKEALYKRKLESVEMAQKVIDKQMVVAQQIASLLGETTAETKVTLNKLKNLIDTEDEY